MRKSRGEGIPGGPSSGDIGAECRRRRGSYNLGEGNMALVLDSFSPPLHTSFTPPSTPASWNGAAIVAVARAPHSNRCTGLSGGDLHAVAGGVQVAT